jgi:hypothetical protein
MTTVGDAIAGTTRGFLYQWEGILKRARISTNAKLVGFVMRTHGNTDGTSVRPSVATLVMETEISYAAVKRARAELISVGLVVLVKRGNRRLHHADEYRLAIPGDILERVRVLSPVEVREGADKINNERRLSDDDRIVRRRQRLAEADQGSLVSPDGIDQGSPVSPTGGVQGSPVSPDGIDQGSGEAPDTGYRAQGGALYPVSGLTTDPPPSFRADQPRKATNPDHLPADHSLASLPPLVGQNGHVVQLVMESGQNARPGKCGHGLPDTTRPDGTPACAHCRRGLPAATPSDRSEGYL